MDATFLTPPEVAKRLRVSPETVIGWIKSGELAAINSGKQGCIRPRYRILEADLQSFIQRRYIVPPIKPQRMSRQDPEVIEFFK